MKRCSVILLFCVLLSGCTNMSSPTPKAAGAFKTESVEERRTQLENVQSWNARGAISVQQASQSPMMMRYDWHQFGLQRYHVDLTASLNLATVSMTGQPGRVTLQKSHEPPVSAATPEQLMQKSLGWSLPIPSLGYWARGLPAPGAHQRVQYDSYGHMTHLNQDGWQVTLEDYGTVQGVDLPGVINLSRAGIRVKIVIKNWQINKSPRLSA